MEKSEGNGMVVPVKFGAEYNMSEEQAEIFAKMIAGSDGLYLLTRQRDSSSTTGHLGMLVWRMGPSEMSTGFAGFIRDHPEIALMVNAVLGRRVIG